MKININLSLIIFLLLPCIAFGKVQEFNKLPDSPFNHVSISEVIGKAYPLVNWNNENGQLLKYQDGNTILYLFNPNTLKGNSFLVIPINSFEAFLELLEKCKNHFNGMSDNTNKKSETIEISGCPTDFEFIYEDTNSGDTYLYGAKLKEPYFWRMNGTPMLSIAFHVPKAPKIPFYKSGNEVPFFYQEKELGEMLFALNELSVNTESKVNPNTFQLIGTYPYRIGERVTIKRDILKYGKGIETKYYIELSKKYIDDNSYKDYLWIKGIKFNLFKKWINDLYSAFVTICSNDQTNNDHITERIPLPPGLSFGGIIRGQFDMDMTVIEGYALNDENVEADIYYNDFENGYHAIIKFGEIILSFDTPPDLKNFIDAFDK